MWFGCLIFALTNIVFILLIAHLKRNESLKSAAGYVLVGLNFAMSIAVMFQLGWLFTVRLSEPGKICSGDYIPENAKY
jgi:hypothetical protein